MIDQLPLPSLPTVPKWLVVVVSLLLVSWWLVSYVRERSADDATARVAAGIGSLGLALAGIVSTLLSQGAGALSLVGDVVGANAGYFAHGIATLIGYTVLAVPIPITPNTWIVVMALVLVVLIMFDRGDR